MNYNSNGFNQSNGMVSNGNNSNNKSVKGKTSIRTLIKAAATRE
jgi:hypothetical protein